MKKYVLSWYLNPLIIGKCEVAFGLCEKTKNVCLIEQINSLDAALRIFTTESFAVGNECELAERCINSECHLNKRNLEFWKSFGVESIEDLEEMHAATEVIKERLHLEVNEIGTAIIFKKAPILIENVMPRHR